MNAYVLCWRKRIVLTRNQQQDFFWLDTGGRIGSWHDVRLNPSRGVIRVQFGQLILVYPVVNHGDWSGLLMPPKRGRRFRSQWIFRPRRVRKFVNMNMFTNTMVKLSTGFDVQSSQYCAKVKYTNLTTAETRVRKFPVSSDFPPSINNWESCVDDDDVVVISTNWAGTLVVLDPEKDYLSVPVTDLFDVPVERKFDFVPLVLAAASRGGVFIGFHVDDTNTSTFRVYGPWHAQHGAPATLLPIWVCVKATPSQSWFSRISFTKYAIGVPGSSQRGPHFIYCFEHVASLRAAWIWTCIRKVESRRMT